jgi:hypothetical protein
MHLLHLWARVSRIRKVPDSDLGWEDMYREGEGEAWFDWVRPPLSTFSNVLTLQVLLDNLSHYNPDCCFVSQHILSLHAYQALPSPSPA